MAGPIRLPLVSTIETRDTSAQKDAKLLNGFIEKLSDGPWAVKRPGTALYFGGEPGPGQGMVNFLDVIYSITGDALCTQSGHGIGTPKPFQLITGAASFSTRYGHGVVAFNNQIFVMGGIDQTEATLGDIYASVDGLTWTQKASNAPWGPRSDFGLIVFNSALYLLGGRFGSTFYGDVWRSVDGTNWTQVAAGAFPARSNMGFCLFGNRIWVAGGYASSSLNTFNDIWASSDGVNWAHPAPNAPTCPWASRAKFGFGAIANMLVVIGGDLSSNLPEAAGDLWTSPDGIAWTRNSNPFNQPPTSLAANVSWSSVGTEFDFPPVVTLTGGSGTGAVGQIWLADSDFGGDEDPSEIALALVTSAGSGYSSAPIWGFSVFTGTAILPGFLTYLAANGTLGDKRGFSFLDPSTNTLYFIADENAGLDTSPTEVWKTSDGITWALQQSSPQWGQRKTSGTWWNGFWIIGGKNDTTPTYFNDVWGAPLGAVNNITLLNPSTPNLRFTFNQTAESITLPLLFFKSPKDAYTYEPKAGTLTKLTSIDYPATTVPGIAYLDGSFYVMDTTGQIWGSGINQPTSWTALNMIPMQNEPNGGVALAKYANYILALGQWSLQFFYDNNNPAPASPLATNSTLTTTVGCASGDSMVEMQGTVIWIGQTKDAGRAIYMVANLSPQKISTPFVDRILQSDSLSTVYAFATGAEGHNFYVLTLVNSNITLVYDFSSNEWFQWTSRTVMASLPVTSITCDAYGTVTVVCPAHGRQDGDPVIIAGASDSHYNGFQNATVVDLNTFTYQVNTIPAANTSISVTMTASTESWFFGVAGAGLSGAYYVQHATNGNVYKLDMSIYTDDSAPLDVRMRTALWDGGVVNWKTFPEITLIADIVSARALVRYTNDDYNTFSSYRSVDMSMARKHLTRMGRARRRAYEVRFTGNTPMRMKAIEFIPEVGDF